jgi:hypothetical protein
LTNLHKIDIFHSESTGWRRRFFFVFAAEKPRVRRKLSRNIGKVKDKGAVAQTHRLPFDRLRASGGVLKSPDFPVHAELVEA